MERQRSFSFKPTRFLLFSFTIFSAVIFFFFFSISVMTTVTSNAGFRYRKPLLDLPPKPVNVETLSGFNGKNSENDVKNPITVDESLSEHEDASGSANISVSDGIQRGGNESEVVSGEDTSKNGALPSNFTTAVESVSNSTSVEKIEVHTDLKIEENKNRECDVWKGKWVFDESYPLYTNQSCPFIDGGFDCGGNGRLDKEYMKWRWQPHDCDIPR